MRVALHIGQLLQPVPGGIGRYVEALLDALPDAGVDLHPFAAGPRPSAVPAGMPYDDLGWPHGSLRYECWHRLRRPCVGEGVDVVHAPSLAVPPSRAPMVVTVHDVAFLRFPEAFTPRGVEFHRRGLALAHQHADAVITASRFSAEELVRAGFEPERLHLAPHGVHVPRPELPVAIDARLRALGVRSPFVLFVGTLEPRKGLDVLTDAFSMLRRAHPSLTLVVVGPRGWLEVRGVDAPGIQVMGRVDDVTLDGLYRRAVACAVPSQYEGFGLPALEAMARGTPLVASNATSLPEVVGDAGWLAPPRDVDAWVVALGRLIEDPHARDELAAAGRARANRFTWAHSATAHAAAYRAAVERHARS